MAHIRYGNTNYTIPDEKADGFKQIIAQILEKNGSGTLRIVDREGDTSDLFISRGVPIVINSWESPI